MAGLKFDDTSVSLPQVSPHGAASRQADTSPAIAAKKSAEDEWSVTLELSRAEKKLFRDYDIPMFSSNYSQEAHQYEKNLTNSQEIWDLNHIGSWAVSDGNPRPSAKTLTAPEREMIKLHQLRKKGRNAFFFGKLRGYEGRLTYPDLKKMINMPLTYPRAINYRTEMLSIIILHIQEHSVLSAEDIDILKRARTVLSDDSERIKPENSQFIKNIINKLNELLSPTDHQDHLAAKLDDLRTVEEMETQHALSPENLKQLQTIHLEQPKLSARIDNLLTPHLEQAIATRSVDVLRLMTKFPGPISLRATLILQDLERPVA